MHVVENKPHVNIVNSPDGTTSGGKRVTRPLYKIKPGDLLIVYIVKRVRMYCTFIFHTNVWFCLIVIILKRILFICDLSDRWWLSVILVWLNLPGGALISWVHSKTVRNYTSSIHYWLVHSKNATKTVRKYFVEQTLL